MTRSIKLLPFVFLMVMACQKEENTNQKLRDEIELKTNEKMSLQGQVAARDADVKAKSDELEALRLSGGPEAVKKAENERAAALAAKVEAEKALAVKNLEVKLATEELAKANTSHVDAIEALKAEHKSAMAIKEKKIEDLNTELKNATGESVITDLRAQLQKATEDKAKIDEDYKNKVAELEGKQIELADVSAKLVTSEKAKSDLEAKSIELSTQLTAKDKQLNELNDKITELNSRPITSSNPEEINKLQEKLAQITKDLEALGISKKANDVELLRVKSIIESTLMNSYGMYLQKDKLAIDNSDCSQFVYVQNSGEILHAIVCEDGRIQYEKRTAISFEVKADAARSKLGLNLDTKSNSSSCGTNKSMFDIASDYTFDRTTRIGTENTESIFMSSKMNGKGTVFTAAIKDYTYAECDQFRNAMSHGFPDQALGKKLLLVCGIAEASVLDANTNVGCFTSSSTFVK